MVVQKAPPAPANFDAARLFGGIFWHQRWELFEGIFTPGSNSIDQMCARFDLPADLAGKRVLDIGAWNGCHSFECERRGAREVIALGPEQPDKTGFNRLREAIGSTRVKYVLGSVYDLDPQKLGFFDVVLFCGVLYHLRYPLLGIDNIRRVCSGDVFIETYVQPPRRARSKWVYRFARLLGLGEVAIPSSTIPVHERPPCWDFFRHNELQADYSNWFGPNISAVLQAFESAGFATRLVWDTVVRDSFGRATFHGKVKAGVPEFLRIPCGESVFYDVIASHLFGKERVGLRGDVDLPGNTTLPRSSIVDKAA